VSLADTFDAVRPSIIAFTSRLIPARAEGPPAFPPVFGTGFFVDRSRIVATNRHVAEELDRLPLDPRNRRRGGVGIIFVGPMPHDGNRLRLGTLFLDVESVHSLAAFETAALWYGPVLPDIAFVRLRVREVPWLPLVTDLNVHRAGVPVATAGFPLGTDVMLVHGGVTQLTPLLRHGIISSVFPFQAPVPCGFTIDVMQQRGSSGSPIFLPENGRVVGILHAGFPQTNLTLAVTSHLLRRALESFQQQDRILPVASDLVGRCSRGSHGSLTL